MVISNDLSKQFAYSMKATHACLETSVVTHTQSKAEYQAILKDI